MTSVPNLQSARRRASSSTRQLVHGVLRRQIVDLELPPGTPLSEADIAQRFGVSRTPVRESLLLLAGEGLVEIYPQRGSFVGPIVYEAVVSSQFVREALECTALTNGASSIDAASIAELRGILVRQREADASGDVDEFFLLDEAFHQRLMSASGHADAWDIVSRAKSHMDRARRLSLPTAGKVSGLIGQHEGVIDAIEGGDYPAAVERLQEHLRLVLSDIQKIQEESPELFGSHG